MIGTMHSHLSRSGIVTTRPKSTRAARYGPGAPRPADAGGAIWLNSSVSSATLELLQHLIKSGMDPNGPASMSSCDPACASSSEGTGGGRDTGTLPTIPGLPNISTPAPPISDGSSLIPGLGQLPRGGLPHHPPGLGAIRTNRQQADDRPAGTASTTAAKRALILHDETPNQFI